MLDKRTPSEEYLERGLFNSLERNEQVAVEREPSSHRQPTRPTSQARIDDLDRSLLQLLYVLFEKRGVSSILENSR